MWAMEKNLFSGIGSPILAFLGLDLSFYYWHRLNHRAPFLWRFHNCHHSDPDLDATTSFRFHPGEIVLSSSLRLVQGAIIAPVLSVVFAHELIFQACTFFHHSNIRMPKKLDWLLSYVIITPRMHGIHHSNYKSETDSNYGVIFSFWDRLHGTFRNSPAQKKITIGVPGYGSPEDNKTKELLKAPFKQQKDYWRGRIKRPE